MVSVEFDSKVNAMYIRLREGKVDKSEPLADNVIVDIDKSGEIIGVEILLSKLDAERINSITKALKVKIEE